MREQHIKSIWDEVKAVLRGKFSVKCLFQSRKQTLKINNLSFHLDKLEK